LLLLAGAYNVGWGAFIYYFPASFYQWITETSVAAPGLIKWQGAGVLLFGMAYILVALYPNRFWWVVPLGIVSKLFGAIGFYLMFIQPTLTDSYLFHLIMNDLLWLIPLTIIFVRMIQVRKQNTHEAAS
ncbi:MAG: hypothetical protein WBA23_04165, partial [Tunicatimonas sp.]|uniref:hypothetical protein n=1 Tax=Tunicatimonas sp. TaxID=1940096 RepID=UPI003C74C5A1